MPRKDAIARPEPVAATSDVAQASVQDAHEIPTIEKLKNLAAVTEHELKLVYIEPTEPEAPHAITAYNETGEMITFGQGEDFEDAYLDIGDKLDPNVAED